MSDKIAIVLLNLGGPSGPDAIEPYLCNFFSDPNIIGLPAVLRLPLARLIAARRARGEAHETYMALGGKSPLLENTQAQATALEERLKQEGVHTRVFVSMRYWHPRAREVVSEIAAWKADRILFLPLYPQYSTATTKSSFEEFQSCLNEAGVKTPVLKICCWPVEEGFIAASAGLIRAAIGDKTNFRLIFSAHGLPERTIRKGDPYQFQAEETGRAIIRRLGIEDLDWSFAYQSRVGPLKWIGPSILSELERAAKDKKGVVIYPQAFVSEHAETLVELDQMYKAKAKDLGIPFYIRVPTVGTHPDFMTGLCRLARSALENNGRSDKICRKGKKLCGN